MKLTKLASLALAGALTLGLLPALSSPALATGGDTNTYTVTIPSELTVNDKGWNEITGGIKAKGTLESGKKLTVTATSTTNSYKLKSGENEIGYNLAKTGDSNSTYNASAEVPKWEFAELKANEDTTLTAGIIVEDYTDKPAGTYKDTVTFTASVEDAAVVKTLTIKKGNSIADSDTTIEYCEGDTWADAVARNPDKIAIDALLNPHRIVLPGQTGNDIDLCKDVDDSNHLVLPTDTIVADGNYLWW